MKVISSIPAFMLAAFAAGYSSAQAGAGPSEAKGPFQAEIEQFVQADKVAPPAPCQVLFVGSSSIVEWTTLVRDMAPLPVINRGFGGAHIEHINYWFDKIVAPYRPRAIVFYAGENDLDAGESVRDVVADFAKFMERKTAVLGQIPVYFVSLKPSKLRFTEFARQNEVNKAIRQMSARRSDLQYIDVVAPMLEAGKPKDLFLQDRLHMTADGYAIWTRLIRAALLFDAAADERACHQVPLKLTGMAPYTFRHFSFQLCQA
jgi:GDSL-like Lipase/Acylhydrolase family